MITTNIRTLFQGNQSCGFSKGIRLDSVFSKQIKEFLGARGTGA